MSYTPVPMKPFADWTKDEKVIQLTLLTSAHRSEYYNDRVANDVLDYPVELIRHWVKRAPERLQTYLTYWGHAVSNGKGKVGPIPILEQLPELITANNYQRFHAALANIDHFVYHQLRLDKDPKCKVQQAIRASIKKAAIACAKQRIALGALQHRKARY